MIAAEQVREVLQSGTPIDDRTFDRLYSLRIRGMSELYWTPVSVALRASVLLAPEPGMSVLDVGAGPGKMCCVGALVTDALWHGVERDPDLVATAYATAIALQVDHRVTFTTGDMTAVSWKSFDSLYLYNPFEAALFTYEPIHDPVEQSARWAAYCVELERTESLLAEMPAGTRVVTYHGFGGEMPRDYSLVHRDSIGTDYLSFWIKRSNARLLRKSGMST
jgi:SAM-dependent methyltransferase